MNVKACVRTHRTNIDRANISLMLTATSSGRIASRRIIQYAVIREQAYVRYWDAKKGCHKTSSKKCPATINIEASAVDVRITELISYVKTCYEKTDSDEIANGWLKNTVSNYYNSQREPSKNERPVCLMEYFERFISKADRRKDRNTNKYIDPKAIVKYKRCYTLLKEYLVVNKRKDIPLVDIDKVFYDGFVDYMYLTYNYAANTVGSRIKELKVVLGSAEEDGCVVSQSFHKFKVMTEDLETVYLTEEEQERLFNTNYASIDKNKVKTMLLEYQAKYPDMKVDAYLKDNLKGLSADKLSWYRDAMIVLCKTAQRISDINKIRLTPGIKTISFHQQKTGKLIYLPIHYMVHKVFARYNYQVQFNFYPQEFNDYVKIACMVAGIDTPFEQQKTIGGKRVVKIVPKFMLISSHTGRRSFCTNEYMKNGKEALPIPLIMSVSGHTSESSFRKYIKATNEDFAKRISEAWSRYYELTSKPLF